MNNLKKTLCLLLVFAVGSFHSSAQDQIAPIVDDYPLVSQAKLRYSMGGNELEDGETKVLQESNLQLVMKKNDDRITMIAESTLDVQRRATGKFEIMESDLEGELAEVKQIAPEGKSLFILKLIKQADNEYNVLIIDRFKLFKQQFETIIKSKLIEKHGEEEFERYWSMVFPDNDDEFKLTQEEQQNLQNKFSELPAHAEYVKFWDNFGYLIDFEEIFPNVEREQIDELTKISTFMIFSGNSLDFHRLKEKLLWSGVELYLKDEDGKPFTIDNMTLENVFGKMSIRINFTGFNNEKRFMLFDGGSPASVMNFSRSRRTSVTVNKLGPKYEGGWDRFEITLKDLRV